MPARLNHFITALTCFVMGRGLWSIAGKESSCARIDICASWWHTASERGEKLLHISMSLVFPVSRMWFSFGVNGKRRKDVRLFDVSTVQVRSFSRHSELFKSAVCVLCVLHSVHTSGWVYMLSSVIFWLHIPSDLSRWVCVGFWRVTWNKVGKSESGRFDLYTSDSVRKTGKGRGDGSTRLSLIGSRRFPFLDGLFCLSSFLPQPSHRGPEAAPPPVPYPSHHSLHRLPLCPPVHLSHPVPLSLTLSLSPGPIQPRPPVPPPHVHIVPRGTPFRSASRHNSCRMVMVSESDTFYMMMLTRCNSSAGSVWKCCSLRLQMAVFMLLVFPTYCVPADSPIK